MRLEYFAWLPLALRTARRLESSRPFDYVWHVTFANLWYGTVGGLVFAQSRTDPTVGFALDPVAVAADVMPTLGSTAAANLGACLR